MLKPYLPEKLPLESYKLSNKTYELLAEASLVMGEYRGYLSSIINPMLLISPLINQEAVLSSKLEGTHATLEDVLNFEAGMSIEIETDEINEIINYREALFYALKNISTINDLKSENTLPLSSRIIKEMHKILLNNVRGSKKNPGNFKKNQNYIGGAGEITFIPVSPDKTEEYISNLENYIHSDRDKLLIMSAIIHAQFEMIHPFEDGNGRIGRLLIPLFLYYRELLPYPTFYMSKFFEKDRINYIDNLERISKNNDWDNWIQYYLKGVILSANESIIKAKKIITYYDEIKNNVLPKLNSSFGIKVLDFIFIQPIFNAKQLSEKCEFSDRTAYKLINILIEEGVLESNDRDRYKTYYCKKIIGIL